MSRSARFAILALAALGTACSPRPGQKGGGVSFGGPAIVFSKVSLAEYEGSAKIWNLEADRVRYDNRWARLEGLTVRYFRDGIQAAVCRAAGGTLDTESHDITFDGPVTFQGAGGKAILEGARGLGAERKLVAGQLQARFQLASRR
jgi:hypothetical protein